MRGPSRLGMPWFDLPVVTPPVRESLRPRSTRSSDAFAPSRRCPQTETPAVRTSPCSDLLDGSHTPGEMRTCRLFPREKQQADELKYTGNAEEVKRELKIHILCIETWDMYIGQAHTTVFRALMDRWNWVVRGSLFTPPSSPTS